jgi:spore coat protein A, manganese oxidase
MIRRITRRQALKIGASAGAGVGMSLVLRRAYPQYIRRETLPLHESPTPVTPLFAQSPIIQKFVVGLPGLGPSNAANGQYIPVATPTPRLIAGVLTDVYELGAAEFPQQILPTAAGGATTLWGYYDKPAGREDGERGRGLTPWRPHDNSKRYLGAAIVATRGRPVLLNVTNELPTTPLVPVDLTIMASASQTVGDLPMNRIATHLHGGFSPWFSDGTPFQWYTPAADFQTGPSFLNVPTTNPAPGTATYYHPMDQSARLLWYHDHAIGITRTNVYAGLASPFIITDDFEQRLLRAGLLPDNVGGPLASVGVPLVIQDKTFVSADIVDQDPSYGTGPVGGNAAPGNLWYPHIYEPNQEGGTGTGPSCVINPTGRWDYGPCVPGMSGNVATLPADNNYTLPTPSCVPEGFFDTILINGAVYPTVAVPPQRVRFRILNASNARFFHLSLYPEDPSHPGEATVTLGNAPGFDPDTYAAGPVYVVAATPGPTIYQVGNEGGFLPQVVVHDNTTAIAADLETDNTGGTVKPDGPFNLLLAPAERADIIIDFNGEGGNSFILYNDAPAPFPGGDPRNDYFTDFTGTIDNSGAGGAPPTQLGFGPNTRTLMQIKVEAGAGDPVTTNRWLRRLNPLLAANFGSRGQQQPPLYPGTFLPGTFVPFTDTPSRVLTLSEDFDEYGRLLQMMGTNEQLEPPNDLNNQGDPTWGRPYVSTPTETPSAGAVEVWQILNTTADTHPMHFHLVNVQVLQRQAFAGDPSNFTLGDPTPPDDNERGWKETVRMNPGEATTIMMQFTLPTLPAAMGNPTSPRTGGHEYVWHCHILEHEDHDMMRPVVVS